MPSVMTSNAAGVDASAATASKPRRRRKPQQSSHTVSDLVQSALAAKQREDERALAAQTRRLRKRGFRKPQSSTRLRVVGGAREHTNTDQARDACEGRGGSGAVHSSGGAVVVVVENLVDPEELEDSDEYDDVVADLERDFQSYGDLLSLRVSRATGVVTLQVADSDCANAVVHEKHGKLFGGREVVARLVQCEEGEPNPKVAPPPPPLHIRASPRTAADEQAQTQAVDVDPALQKKKKKRRSKCKSAVLREREKTKSNANVAVGAGGAEIAPCRFLVCNLIASDEIEDEDELKELHADTRVDFATFGALTHLEVVVTRGDDSAEDTFHQHDSTTTTATMESSSVVRPGDVVVEYGDPDCAAAAFRAFDGKVFGGRVVECQWVSSASFSAPARSTASIQVENMLSPDELEDADEYEDIRDEVADIFARHGAVETLDICRTSGEVTVTYKLLEAAQQAVVQMNQSTHGGRSVKVSLLSVDDDDGDNNELQKEESEARPDRPFVVTERAHQQNPLQDKRSRRLVLGLHEVKRGLLSKKIRLLIVGTDVEECGVLDEKLSEILAMAKRDQVPAVFPMTRRKLGRALSKNVRVSCVGVYSFEGANELFAQITRNVSTFSAE